MATAQSAYGRKVRRSTSNLSIQTATASQKKLRTPAPKRTVRRRGPAWSAPSRRQQTITQMNPFHSLYHPEIGELELQYENDIHNASDSPPRVAKRRKIAAEETPVYKASTMSEMQEAPISAPQPRQTLQFKSEPASQVEVLQCEDSQTSARMMPPPQTPKTTRRKEIPSSQSPPDTPLSAQSQNPVRNYYRSPLKEKSTNVITPRRPSSRKGVEYARLKNVAKSMDHEDGDSPTNPLREDLTPRTRTRKAEAAYEQLLALQSSILESPEDHEASYRHLKANQCSVPAEENKQVVAERHSHIRIEVFDSDVGEDDDDARGANAAHEEYKAVNASVDSTSVETQAIITSLHAISSSVPEENEPHSEPIPQSFKAGLPPVRLDVPEPRVDVPSSQPHDEGVEEVYLAGSFPQDKEQYGPAPTKDTQELASDQLHYELERYTQAQGIWGTDSQYENGWESYHPPTGATPAPSSSCLQPISSPPQRQETDPTPMTLQTPSSSSKRHTSNATPLTVPTQLLPKSHPSTFQTPIPPSQATTVDVTQPSHYHNNQQHISTQTLLSSPPPVPPPFSSNPSLSRKGISQKGGYEWDGRILRDSELLPASLMEDSILGPSRWQEDEEGS